MSNPLGSAPGIMVGVGVGTAGSAAIEPLVEPGKQNAWQKHPNRVLDPAVYARLVAQGAIDITVGRPLARREGYNEDQFNRLVHLAQTAPDLALTLELWRRGQFGDPTKAPALFLVDHALAKAQIEQQYWKPIKELFSDRLAPPVIALAIVRGIMKDPGFLPVGPPSTEGKVKAFPVSKLNTLEEARAHGFDFDRLFVETAIAGRPMGPEAAAAAVFRDILERVDYDRAIAEGDVRNEWADAIFETARQIPSVSDAVNLRIRGWIDTAQMHALAARHGMSAADVDLLLLRTGRPATAHQVFIGERRGGKRNGSLAGIPDDIQTAIRQSDIRPEWINPIYHGLETFPSGFMIRGAVQAGDLTQTQAKTILYQAGWRQEWIDIFVASWAGGAQQATVSAPARLATSQARASLKKRYLVDHIDTAGVLSGLELLGSDAAEAGHILEMWTLEKGWLIKLLTPAQIKKAYRGGELTQDEAIAGLVEQHYNVPDATLYLTE